MYYCLFTRGNLKTQCLLINYIKNKLQYTRAKSTQTHAPTHTIVINTYSYTMVKYIICMKCKHIFNIILCS